MAGRLDVGRVGRPHGLRGEVTVVAHDARDERFEPGAQLFAGDRPVTVASARRHRQGWLVRFVGVEDRDGAEELRGCVLSGEPIPGPDRELRSAHALVGASVRTSAGRGLGTVTAVEPNPAHDLLVLDSGLLVPLPFVVEADESTVTVELPEGLEELR